MAVQVDGGSGPLRSSVRKSACALERSGLRNSCSRAINAEGKRKVERGAGGRSDDEARRTAGAASSAMMHPVSRPPRLLLLIRSGPR